MGERLLVLVLCLAQVPKGFDCESNGDCEALQTKIQDPQEENLAGGSSEADNALGRAILLFGNPSVSRATILAEFRSVLHRDLSGEQARYVKRSIAILERMTREDAEYLQKRSAQGAAHNSREKIAELIFCVRPANRVFEGRGVIPPKGGHNHGPQQSAE
jgi:hypothetical protein